MPRRHPFLGYGLAAALLSFGGCKAQTKPPSTVTVNIGTEQVQTTTKDGAASGAIHSSSRATQVIQASADSTISGATASFAPGALSVDTTVTVEAAAPLATAASLANVGIPTDTGVQSSGTAVDLASSASFDPIGDIALSVPLPTGAGLLDSSLDNLVIVYRVMHFSEAGKAYDGIITASDLTVKGNLVALKTKYFGAFQAVILTKKLAAAPAPKPALAPILTATAQKSLPDISLQHLAVTPSGASVALSASVAGGTLSTCAFELSKVKAAPYDGFATSSGASSATLTGIAAGTYYARLDCLDQYGRNIFTDWSAAILVAGAAVPSPTPADPSPSPSPSPSATSSPSPQVSPQSPSLGGPVPGDNGAIIVHAGLITPDMATGAVALSWAAASPTFLGADVATYDVYYATSAFTPDQTGGQLLFQSLSNTTFNAVVTGLVPSKMYYFSILERDTSGGTASYQVVSACSSIISGSAQCPLSLPQANTSVTTDFGSGTPGFSDAGGNPLRAAFRGPEAITFDGTYLYVADTGNNAIRRIDPRFPGSVITITGSGTSSNTSDAIGVYPANAGTANVGQPCGIVYDAGTSSLYVATVNSRIMQIVIGQGNLSYTTQFFLGDGNANVYNSADVPELAANVEFNRPCALATDGVNLYVADAGGAAYPVIRRINLTTKIVDTIAGGSSTPATPGNPVIPGVNANLGRVNGLQIIGTLLYLSANNNIQTVDLAAGHNFAVSLISGSNQSSGCVDASLETAQFFNPQALVFDNVSLYLSEGFTGNDIRQIALGVGDSVKIFAGANSCASSSGGSADVGPVAATVATFNRVLGMVSDGTSLWVVDQNNHVVRRLHSP